MEDLRARFGEGGSLALAAKAAGAAASKPLHWYVPLGMAAWFHDAGVRDVTELDWWQEASHGGVRVACTPAQHWSARTPFDKNTTLWASWYDFSVRLNRCVLCADAGIRTCVAQGGDRQAAPLLVRCVSFAMRLPLS